MDVARRTWAPDDVPIKCAEHFHAATQRLAFESKSGTRLKLLECFLSENVQEFHVNRMQTCISLVLSMQSQNYIALSH